MRKLLIAAFVVLLPSGLTAQSAVATVDAATQARIENGLLSGVAGLHPEVRVFKGIPYAAPPVGDLRWKPPQPAANWRAGRKTGAR